MQLLPTQNIRLLFVRIFAGAMLFVWFANSLPPLIAMTSSQIESCQMECCKGFKRHSVGSSSAEMCPMKAQRSASHQMTHGAEHETMHGAEEPAEEHVAAEKDENSVVGSNTTKVIVFGSGEQWGSLHDDNTLPSIRIKIANKCPRTACITSSSSSFGQRQQQSSDNCLLFSFAVNLPPPSFVLVEVGTQASFIFTQLISAGQTPSRGPPAFLS